MQNWLTSPNFNFLKWFVFFLFAVVSGVIVALILAGIIYGMRKKQDENMTYSKALQSIIMPSVFTGVTIVFVVVAKMRFPGCYPYELLILSAIIISGVFSTIQSKNPATFFLGLIAVFLYLGAKSGIPFLTCNIKDLYYRITCRDKTTKESIT